MYQNKVEKTKQSYLHIWIKPLDSQGFFHKCCKALRVLGALILKAEPDLEGFCNNALICALNANKSLVLGKGHEDKK